MKQRVWLLLVTIGILVGMSTSGYAGDVHTLTVGVQSPATIAQGGSGTFLVTLSRKNGGNAVPVNLTITGLPAGAAGSFSPNNFSMNTGTTNATLTVTASNSTPGGVTTFAVVDTHAHVQGTGTLTVGYLTTTAVSSSSNPATYGQAVALTATVSSDGGTPGGTVMFNDGATVLGTMTLDGSGQATFSTNTLSVAGSPHSISVVYAGQGNFLNSTSSVLTQAVVAVQLVVTGITASNKTYDGTTTTTLNTGSAALVGIIGSDDVTLDTASAAGAFSTVNVGSNLAVTVSGLTLGGTSAGNYTLLQPVTTADITAAQLTATADVKEKTYGVSDPGLTYQVTVGALVSGDTLSGELTRAAGEDVGAYAIGQGTLSAGDNYALSFVPADLTIEAAGLTVMGITAGNKPYDGTMAATLNTNSAVLVGVIGADDVTLDTAIAAGTFSTANAGTNLVVTVSGLALGGTKAGNYTLTQPTTTADITAVGLTVTGITAGNKPYDGTTAATLNTNSAALVGVIGSDDVTLDAASAAGTFSTTNAGTNLLVTVSGLTLGGTKAGNYTLTQPTTTADITAVGLTVTGITAGNKPYDGTTTATLNTNSAALVGVIGSDDVTLMGSAVGLFSTANAGTNLLVTVSGLTLGGTKAGNYTLTQPTAMADITAVGLTVTGISAGNKPYDGTTAATLNTNSAALVGVIGSDDVTLDTASAAGVFSTANAGTNLMVTVSGLTLGGTAAGNYTLTQPTTTADITAANLSCEIASSANPCLPGSNVTFTVTLNAILPGGGTPSGVVQFVIDGVPFGSPLTLGDGIASTGVVSLAHGQHTVLAEYTGDGNFGGITNSLSPDQIVNTPPVVMGDTLGAVQNVSMNWATVKVLTNDLDADGDLLSVINVGAESAQGGAVLLGSGTITYTPPIDYAGPDSFTYIVADAFGGMGTGTVSVIVNSAANVEQRVVRIEMIPINSVTVTLSGIPGTTYIVQGATSLEKQDWNAISTNEADVTGLFSIIEDDCLVYPYRYYRSLSQ